MRTHVLILMVSVMCLAVGCTVDESMEAMTESEMRAVHSYCDGWELCTLYVSNDGYFTDIVCTLSAQCVGTEGGIAPLEQPDAEAECHSDQGCP